MGKIEIKGLYEPPETGPLAEMTPDQIEKLLMWQHLLEQIYERIRPASLNSTGLM